MIIKLQLKYKKTTKILQTVTLDELEQYSFFVWFYINPLLFQTVYHSRRL